MSLKEPTRDEFIRHMNECSHCKFWFAKKSEMLKKETLRNMNYRDEVKRRKIMNIDLEDMLNFSILLFIFSILLFIITAIIWIVYELWVIS